jgi:hypothetical protein
MMAAPGWGAAYALEDGEETIEPLVGWALVQESDTQKVIGMVATQRVEFCDDHPNFTGYVHMQDVVMGDMDLDLDDLDYDVGLEEDDEPDDEPPPPPRRSRGSRLN